jgi:hypothetical protein
MERTAPEKLDLPAEVVYFNQWTDFQGKEIGRLFECIPFQELAKLTPGTTIWLDSQQPSGKVYGYCRADIVDVEDRGQAVGIAYIGPNIEGGAVIKKEHGWHKVHRCTDPARLVELIKKSPLALETGTAFTLSDESRAYLESIGAVIVPSL